jgi:hypothetical protein
MSVKKQIIENIDGFAMFALIWAFVINLAVLLINLFRHYVLETASWSLIESSFVFAVAIIVLLVILLAVISPLYQKLVKATKVPNETQLDNAYFRRKTRAFIADMFECSKDEARAIDKFWEQLSLDLVKLAAPSICTPAKIFDETEKAMDWQRKRYDYEKSDFGIRDPRNSLRLRMFKHAASIRLMLEKIRDFCATTPSIVNVSEADILAAYEDYIASLLSEPRTQEQHKSLSKPGFPK